MSKPTEVFMTTVEAIELTGDSAHRFDVCRFTRSWNMASNHSYIFKPVHYAHDEGWWIAEAPPWKTFHYRERRNLILGLMSRQIMRPSYIQEAKQNLADLRKTYYGT